MIQFGIGLFILLHGLVHLWYVTLSQRLVAFKPEMGWSGQSWLLTTLVGDPTTRTLASAAYILSTLGFVAAGIGVFSQQAWSRPLIAASAVLSALSILLFWDGSSQHIVEKGLVGLLINVAVLAAVLVSK